MVYCQKCGKEVDSGAAFCPGCGASVAGGGPSNSGPAYNNGPAYNSGPAYSPGPEYNNNAYGGANTAAPQKSTGIGIVLAFLIPGAGHLYAGKITDGIVIFVISLILVAVGWFLLFIPFIVAFILWIWNIYDANKKINEYNDSIRRTGNPPW